MPDDDSRPDDPQPDVPQPEDRQPDDRQPEPHDELSAAVEDALAPAKHDSVMAIWQQVVLGRLDRGHPQQDEETREALRRLYGETDPPAG